MKEDDPNRVGQHSSIRSALRVHAVNRNLRKMSDVTELENDLPMEKQKPRGKFSKIAHWEYRPHSENGVLVGRLEYVREARQ